QVFQGYPGRIQTKSKIPFDNSVVYTLALSRYRSRGSTSGIRNRIPGAALHPADMRGSHLGSVPCAFR
ncbi:MAG: hypothetical protein VX809_02415, partial [Pseudomonadota bacterium]|nr:hypothetical protein [Pseudomonadota bacterium]